MKTWLLITGLILGTTTLVHAQAEPPYGMSHIAAYSVFTDAIRTNDHEMALQFGEWMLEAKPREIEGVTTFRLDRQFHRLIGVYTGLADDEADPTERADWLRKAEEVFELTFDTFEENEIDRFQWYLRAGRFYQEYHGSLAASSSEAFQWYERAFEEDPETFAGEGDGYFSRVLLTHYVSAGEGDKAMAMIEQLEETASPELRGELDQFREQLFESPEERIAFIESRLETADEEERESMLTSLLDLFEETENRQRAIDTARQLYELNPNFENTRRVADTHLSDGNYRAAISFLEELLEQSPDDARTGELLVELSETHQQLDELQTARDYARRALNYSAVEGQAHMRLHLIYASAVTRCTQGRTLNRDDRTVYWLVIDHLEQAAATDSSLRSQAQRHIERFREAMPDTQDRFFQGWEPGDSFRIGSNLGDCYAWIDEQTTVKS